MNYPLLHKINYPSLKQQTNALVSEYQSLSSGSRWFLSEGKCWVRVRALSLGVQDFYCRYSKLGAYIHMSQKLIF